MKTNRFQTLLTGLAAGLTPARTTADPHQVLPKFGKSMVPLIALATTLLLAASASAASLTWVGSVSGDRFALGNWSPAQVPPPDDMSVINSDTDTVSGPTVVGAGGVFKWAGGGGRTWLRVGSNDGSPAQQRRPVAKRTHA